MKKFLCIFLLVIFVSCLIISGCAKPSSQSSQSVITLTTLQAFPPGHEMLAPGDWYINEVNKKGKGLVEIVVKGGPEACPAGDQLTMLQDGTIDFLNTCYTDKYIPEKNIGFSFFGATPMEVREAGYLDIFDDVCRQKIGAAVIGNNHYWYGNIFMTKPIKTLADLKGIKVRSMPAYNPVLEELGMVPVQVGPADLYSALETGVVDAVCSAFTMHLPSGCADIAKYVIWPPFWVNINWFTFVNAKKYDSLPSDVKKILLDVAVEADKNAVAIMDKERKKDWEIMRDKYNLTVITLSEQEWMKVQEMQRTKGVLYIKDVSDPELYKKVAPMADLCWPPEYDRAKAPW